MDPKMMMRKKAMDSMMKEGPSLPISKKPMMEEKDAEAGGMVSMMVTPEEQEMILEARKERSGGESEEAPAQEMPMEESEY